MAYLARLLRDRTPHARRYQQPRQMPFTLRSIVLFSSLIAASTPSVDLADPVVTPLPDDCAVPALLVPGAGGAASLDEFPAPLGSWPALFNPPGLAGPEGTPLMPDVPAPADPALGEPAALPLPADDPPALCANEVTGDIRIAIAVTAMVAEACSSKISFMGQRQRPRLVPDRNDFRRSSLPSQLTPGADGSCAN